MPGGTRFFVLALLYQTNLLYNEAENIARLFSAQAKRICGESGVDDINFVGIIAEYDPFHSGHALQLRMLRQQGASTIAVCMSTGVVQRGGVPILPEAVRVRAALAAGADLVVACLLYTSPSPRDSRSSRMPSSA